MKTYEEIVAEVNEVHPCSEKEAAMLYAEQFKQQWIPVTERLPEKLTTVVLHNSDKNKTEIGYYVESIDRFFKNNERAGNFFNVTHWLPLPELPKKD